MSPNNTTYLTVGKPEHMTSTEILQHTNLDFGKASEGRHRLRQVNQDNLQHSRYGCKSRATGGGEDSSGSDSRFNLQKNIYNLKENAIGCAHILHTKSITV